MTDISEVCMNCMGELFEQDGVCPRCGFRQEGYANAAHQLECGSILAGAYLVGRVLGQGGFGITYVGLDLNLELKVAIKEYYPEGCVTRDARTHLSVLTYSGEKETVFQRGKERFINEAKTLAKFAGDSGIVGVRSFFHENGTAYIVMDYVEGETLKVYIARRGGRIPSAEALVLFRPLMRSLARVHEIGLLHRDISPDNIMIKRDGTLTLLDFGAARQMSIEGEHSNTINVKHGFAPEEQYRTRGEQGPWTDVYALAATIYRATTGEMPPQALDRLTNEDKLIPPNQHGADFSYTEECAVMHALAIRAAYRTPNMQKFESELFGGDPATQPGYAYAGTSTLCDSPMRAPGNAPGGTAIPGVSATPAGEGSNKKQKKGVRIAWIVGGSVFGLLVISSLINGAGENNAGGSSRWQDAFASAATAMPTQVPQPDVVELYLDYGERYQCTAEDFDLPYAIREDDVTWSVSSGGAVVTCDRQGRLRAGNIQSDPSLGYNNAVFLKGKTPGGVELQYEVVVGNGSTYSFDWSSSARKMKMGNGYTYIATPAIKDCLGFTLTFGYDLNYGRIYGKNWSVWVRGADLKWVFVGDITPTAGDYEEYEIVFDRPITVSELIVQAPKELYSGFEVSISYGVADIIYAVD